MVKFNLLELNKNIFYLLEINEIDLLSNFNSEV